MNCLDDQVVGEGTFAVVKDRPSGLQLHADRCDALEPLQGSLHSICSEAAEHSLYVEDLPSVPPRGPMGVIGNDSRGRVDKQVFRLHHARSNILVTVYCEVPFSAT